MMSVTKFRHIISLLLLFFFIVLAAGTEGSEETVAERRAIKREVEREIREEEQAEKEGKLSEYKKNRKKTPTDEKPAFYVDKPEGEPVEIFKIGSDLAVFNGGTTPSFTMKKDYWITELWTYHWNDAKGASLGTIALKNDKGKLYGPWKTKGRDGQGGIKNAYWVATPNISLPAGKYTVIDSDPSTLAQNSETNGVGMAWMYGIPEN